MDIVAVDIGGTHARFAIAEIDGKRIVNLHPEVVLKTAEHASLQTAWEAFGQQMDRPLPRAAGIAVACPVSGEVLQMTNNPWVIRPAMIKSKLNVDSYSLINDFAAVGHAVSHLGSDAFRHLCGPDEALPERGVVTVIGPGTGLGAAMVLKSPEGARIIPTEGGHIDYSPLDVLEDGILARLRLRYRRVSIERVVSGPGLANIYTALAEIEGRAIVPLDDATLWRLALDGGDSLAVAALDRFCLSFGSVAGDLALAQGADAVVIAGGVGLKLAEHLPQSGFSRRFCAKGRFEHRMAGLAVKLITYPQPGLLGAAAAYASEHG